LALNKKVTSERFAALSAKFNQKAGIIARFFVDKGATMPDIKIYEIDPHYIDYLSPHAPHLFHNKKASQANTRKYIGILLHVHDFDYFAPLSSFKPKHAHMKNSLDFIKIRNYAVINLNNMFPVPLHVCSYVDFSKVANPQYKDLLLAEYRFIKSIRDKLCKNAATLYHYRLTHNDSTPLSKRCNDFILLEKLCEQYQSK